VSVLSTGGDSVAQNFLPCDREQELLLPPSLREWLPEDHLAWFVLDAVDEIDLTAFYGVYRDDGWGRAAFEPAMMMALLLYAYAVGERSSRGIERRCREDVVFRVITANRIPDHATIARFRARHEPDSPQGRSSGGRKAAQRRSDEEAMDAGTGGFPAVLRVGAATHADDVRGLRA
jgi:transposase